jgi:rhomboid protease GluP
MAPADPESGAGALASPDPARFPLRHVVLVGLVVLAHLALVAWKEGAFPAGQDLLRRGGLVAGQVLVDPWRLFTSLTLHVDARHALMNGASMLVFALPLLGWLGQGRTGTIYVLAGVGGGLVASLVSPGGTIVVGSSGAVAGLFGAWLALALRSARFAPLAGRTRVRILGVGLLVLPSLLSPVSATGRPISVGAHVGGMITGMAIGALLSSRFVPREPAGDEGEAEPQAEREGPLR